MIPAHHPPEHPAITMEPSGASLSYGELDAAANRVSRMFRAAGLQPGDHIAFCLENGLTLFELAWGAHYAGLVYTACSTSLTADELAYIANDCEARMFFLSVRYADRAAAILAATPALETHVAVGGSLDGYEDYEPLLHGHDTTPLGSRVAGRDMLYSSGTTGRPKGIDTTLEAAELGAELGVVAQILAQLGTTADDVYLSPAPLYHAAPLRFSMSMHQLGGHVVTMEKWDERLCLELISRHRVTTAQFVPTMFVRMLRLPDHVRAAADTSSLRLVIHAAAPCPVHVKQQMIEWWGPIIHEYYAGTEGCGLTWITPQEWLAKPGTVGKPMVGIPHIVGSDGEELPPGRDGAVYFSDGPVFAYHNDPDKTAANTDHRGWQTFGDIGHLDEDGYLFLTDRASYTIITGGVNVYPQETEDVLLIHPEVMDVAVFGVPHPEMGEVIQAVVQPVAMPADDAGAAALEAELIDHCRQRLAPFKCPRAIDLRPALPRTETGKLLKRVLKDEYAAALAG